jgi:hypothetical protein
VYYTKDITPSQRIIEQESEHILLSFCTFCTLIKGKKLSLQNVFLLVLQNENFKHILKELIGIDSDIEIVRLFLDFDPTIAKSKYITKYLNSKKRKCQ